MIIYNSQFFIWIGLTEEQFFWVPLLGFPLTLSVISLSITTLLVYQPERLRSDKLNNIKNEILTTFAGFLARTLSEDIDGNEKLLVKIKNWSGYIITSVLFFLLYVKLLHEVDTLNRIGIDAMIPYDILLQILGSIMLACGSVYAIRQSFRENFTQYEFIDIGDGQRLVANQTTSKTDYIKSFIVLFWGAVILVFGYTFPLLEYLYLNGLSPSPTVDSLLLSTVAIGVLAISLGMAEALASLTGILSSLFALIPLIFAVEISSNIHILASCGVVGISISAVILFYRKSNIQNIPMRR